ncbi:MAG: glycine cleavage system protein H [Legionella sp.]|nr:MAG: glycine cleavage system protein H [Legionella sp.]PJE00177.1 MAG: glycine cleavage system protein H [Legionella sp.]
MTTFKFTKTHEWLKNEGDEVVIGITDHAQQLLGDMVFVELPAIGDEVTAGAELGVVESVKAASDFYAPISGTISAVNEAVINDPSLVNHAPYDQGWLVKLKPNNPDEIAALLSETDYQHEIAEDA